MNRTVNLRFVCALFSSTFLCGCMSVISHVPGLEVPLSWENIQTTGGLALGDVVYERAVVGLQVKYDISGLSEEGKVQDVVTALWSISRVKCRIEDREIYLCVMGVPHAKGPKTVTKPVKMGRLKPGKYVVYYSSSDKEKFRLGEIAVSAP